MPYLLINAPYESEESHRIFYKRFGDEKAQHKLIFVSALARSPLHWLCQKG